MDNNKIDGTMECIRRFGNFHDCRILNVNLNFKGESIEFDLSNVLWGLSGTDGYIPGPGKVRFNGVDDISIPEVSIDDDYIFSIKIRGDAQSSQAEIVIGNGREIRFAFQDLEIWKDDKRLV